MRILNRQDRYGGPGSAPSQYWDGSRPRYFTHGLFYNLCTAISSCFYVFCCCWLMEDCFMGRRSFPGPGPPPPPRVGPGPPGGLSTVFGPPGPSHSHYGPGPPGMSSVFGPPGLSHSHYGPEPEPPGILSSVFGQPGPPSGQPGPTGYPGESPPF